MDGSLSDLVKTFPTHACQVYVAPCYEWISWQMLWLRGLRRTNERAEAPAGPVPFRKCFSSNCRHLQEMAWHKRGLLSRCCCCPRQNTSRRGALNKPGVTSYFVLRGISALKTKVIYPLPPLRQHAHSQVVWNLRRTCRYCNLLSVWSTLIPLERVLCQIYPLLMWQSSSSSSS